MSIVVQPLRRYLAAVFALSVAIQSLFWIFGALDSPGVAVYGLIALLGAIPVLAVWWAGQCREAGLLPTPRFKEIPWNRVAWWAAAVIVVIFLGRMIGWLAGVDPIDLQLKSLVSELPHYRELNMDRPVSPIFLLIVGFGLSIAFGFSLFAAPAFGLELGWRAVCLPSLRAIGLMRAAALTGLLQGLAWAPLAITYLASPHPVEALVRWCLICVAIGILLGAIWGRSGHIGLTAMVAGSIAAQWFGMGFYLFPEPVAPWGGHVGYISIACWFVFALAIYFLPSDVPFGETTKRGTGASVRRTRNRRMAS